MPGMLDLDFETTLRAFLTAGVDFIIVGGIAAVLQGAPINTFDLDLVHARNAANTDAILPVLSRIDAYYRMQPERRLRPSAGHLTTAGHLNLITRHGPLDLLGTIGENLSYENLLPHCELLDLGDGFTVRVLNLETLIAIKEQLNGEKDRAVLPILRRTLSLRPPA